MTQFSFKVFKQDKRTAARVGEITTPHGKITTPAFVPVGTQATVKSLTPEELKDLGVELFFVNTYHAYLRPGIEVVKKAGGLHRFMNWDRPLITDSGGFQVFSLGKKRYVNVALSESAVLDREKFTRKLSIKDAQKENVYPDDYRPIGELVEIDDDGVTFTSHWDGTEHRFTPEKSVEMQRLLGADIIIAFDECAPYPVSHAYAKKAMERTHRWAVRSFAAYERSHSLAKNSSYQAMYAAVQGSVYKDLRQISASTIADLDTDGIAIGGVSVGESKEDMKKVCEWVMPHLPQSKPRHLLGVGEIDDIFDIIERGVDTFDCVQPTRLARMGHIFTQNLKLKAQNAKYFTLDITKKIYAQDFKPLNPRCNCYACQNFTRSYLHHLFKVRELLAYRLATIHNVHFVMSLVQEIKYHIVHDSFLQFKQDFLRMK